MLFIQDPKESLMDFEHCHGNDQVKVVESAFVARQCQMVIGIWRNLKGGLEKQILNVVCQDGFQN